MALNVFPEVTMAQQCFAFDLRKNLKERGFEVMSGWKENR